MVFSSLTFLLLFLPLTIACYYLARGVRARNAVLCVLSLVFYAWGGLYYLALMLAVIAINFFGGLWLSGIRVKKSKAWSLVLILATNLGLLFYFKYFNLKLKIN